MPLDGVELMPEPEDSSILTAVDPDAEGYSGDAYGVSDEAARKLRRPVTSFQPFIWPYGAVGASASIIIMVLMWPMIQPLITAYLPASGWAYESSGVDELRDEGLDGSGIKVCIVDTGIDPEHPDFKDMNLVGFRDFYSFDHGTVRDVSQSNHGTAMAGLLVAKGSGPMRGMAPNVELSVAVGLGPEGTTGNSARVADAIQWCRISQQVNIISLSLGGPFEATSQIASRSVAGAVEDALDAGIFVVAAAGNAGPDNTDVSTPANVDRVISVGAYDRFMTPWSNSSIGSQIDPYSETTRTWPNQKPEILGPGSYILSTVSSDKSPPYAYSTGTSDATLFVTGSLALILQDLSQRDVVNISSSNDNRIDIVKRALAESARPMGGQIGHDARSGYGMLDAVEWRNQVESTANQW